MRFLTVPFLAVAATISILGTANSAVYDAFADFGGANPNGSWSYGYGVTGSSFTAFTTFNAAASSCGGYTGPCWNSGNDFVPWVANHSNTNGTVIGVPGVLSLHPFTGADAIVRWTAPSTGNYVIGGLFEILDVSPSGVIDLIYLNSTLLHHVVLSIPGATASGPGGVDSFSISVSLTAGDIMSFGVNDNGYYPFDSTGFQATITSDAPTPASLALLGLGLLGVGATRRRLN